MQFTKTASGNWARQTQSRESKSLGTYLTESEAQAVPGVDEVIHLASKGKVAKRHGVAVGTVVYLAIKYGKTRRYMVHASAAECIARGVAPGACNY
jgi:hypothetical protein